MTHDEMYKDANIQYCRTFKDDTERQFANVLNEVFPRWLVEDTDPDNFDFREFDNEVESLLSSYGMDYMTVTYVPHSDIGFLGLMRKGDAGSWWAIIALDRDPKPSNSDLHKS